VRAITKSEALTLRNVTVTVANRLLYRSMAAMEAAAFQAHFLPDAQASCDDGNGLSSAAHANAFSEQRSDCRGSELWFSLLL
jgi:hypothetical protein